MGNKIINIDKQIVDGFYTYMIDFIDDNNNPGSISLPGLSWNNSEIVNALIRTRYPQDRVEAIINNHFLAIGEWLDKKLSGSNEKFIDEEYDKLQEWRKICKQWAQEALEKYPPVN